MKARTVVHRVVDLQTLGAATLRLALVRDGEAGDVLILSHGFGEGSEFHRPAFCGTPITVAAEHLPEIQRALETLGGGG